MNLTLLLHASNGNSESIHEIIENSYAGTNAPTDSKSGTPETDKKTENNFFSIQTGTFFNESDANKQIIRLNVKGLTPYIFQSVNSKGANVYSVRIGKYATYNSASVELKKLGKDISTPLIITHFDSLEPASSSLAHSETVTATLENDLKSDPLIDETAKNKTFFSENENEFANELMKKIQEMESEIQKLRDESEIRSQLEITDEEAKAEEEDILESAGREYTLTDEGTLKLSYGFSYSYSGYDAIRESTRVEDVADHTISNQFGVSYGLKNNLSVGTSIPFIYKYHKVGTIDSLDTTDFGDLSLSWQFQPLKTNSELPTIILNGNFGIPVGRNPYEIQVGEELSTSSGIYSAGFGASISQVSDPVIVFSSFSVSYPFATQSINQKRDEGTLDEVDPGMGLGASVGLGYALSYKLNINLSFSYSYSFETKYKYKDAPNASTGTSTGASMSIGTGYKVSQNQNLNFSIGIPITSTRSFSISCSTPIDFEL